MHVYYKNASITIDVWIEAAQLGRFAVGLFRFVQDYFQYRSHQRWRAFSVNQNNVNIINI